MHCVWIGLACWFVGGIVGMLAMSICVVGHSRDDAPPRDPRLMQRTAEGLDE